MPETIDCDRCGGPVPTDDIWTDEAELQTLCHGCAEPGVVQTAAELAGGGDPYAAARRPDGVSR